jgi:RecA/RadA recombinase
MAVNRAVLARLAEVKNQIASTQGAMLRVAMAGQPGLGLLDRMLKLYKSLRYDRAQLITLLKEPDDRTVEEAGERVIIGRVEAQLADGLVAGAR